MASSSHREPEVRAVTSLLGPSRQSVTVGEAVQYDGSSDRNDHGHIGGVLPEVDENELNRVVGDSVVFHLGPA